MPGNASEPVEVAQRTDEVFAGIAARISGDIGCAGSSFCIAAGRLPERA
jgi:hypothetical protein